MDSHPPSLSRRVARVAVLCTLAALGGGALLTWVPLGKVAAARIARRATPGAAWSDEGGAAGLTVRAAGLRSSSDSVRSVQTSASPRYEGPFRCERVAILGLSSDGACAAVGEALLEDLLGDPALLEVTWWPAGELPAPIERAPDLFVAIEAVEVDLLALPGAQRLGARLRASIGARPFVLDDANEDPRPGPFLRLDMTWNGRALGLVSCGARYDELALAFVGRLDLRTQLDAWRETFGTAAAAAEPAGDLEHRAPEDLPFLAEEGLELLHSHATARTLDESTWRLATPDPLTRLEALQAELVAAGWSELTRTRTVDHRVRGFAVGRGRRWLEAHVPFPQDLQNGFPGEPWLAIGHVELREPPPGS